MMQAAETRRGNDTRSGWYPISGQRRSRAGSRTHLTNQLRMSDAIAWQPMSRRLFHVQNRRKPHRCQASTVPGCTTWSTERQLRRRCDSHAHSRLSANVKRARGRWL